MAAQLGTPPPDGEVKPVGQRLVKLALIFVAVGCVYYFFSDFVKNLFLASRNAKLEGDIKAISKALDLYQLKNKKIFQDTDLDKLQGETLENIPRDPEGKPYLYDWFFERLVYTGSDGTLQTLVPGMPAPPEGAESDDEIRRFKAPNLLIYASQEGGVARVQQSTEDGMETKTVAEIEGEVLGVSGLAAKEAGIVALVLRKGTATEIQLLDTDAETPKPIPATKGLFLDEWPAIYTPKSEWLFYQSNQDATKDSGERGVFKISYKDKVPARMTVGKGDFIQPSVAWRDKWIWYAGRGRDNYALYQFQLTSYNSPKLMVARTGVDLKAPAPAASNNYVAYLVTTPGKTALEVMALKTQKVIFSREGVLPQGGIVWSPDDQKIAYLTAPQGAPRITMTHVEKKVTVVLGLPVMTQRFAWLHD